MPLASVGANDPTQINLRIKPIKPKLNGIMSLTYNENILSETAVQEHGPTTIFIIERYRVKPMVSAIVCEVHNPEIKPFFNFDLSQDNRKSLRKNSKPLQVAASECKWL